MHINKQIIYAFIAHNSNSKIQSSHAAQVFSGAQHSDKVLAETSDPAAESHVAPVEPGDSAEEMLGSTVPTRNGWSLFSDKPWKPEIANLIRVDCWHILMWVYDIDDDI